MGEEVCRLAVDIGGTFTDVVLWSTEGQTSSPITQSPVHCTLMQITYNIADYIA
jgi:N-methylhydantoinase A/oxoprolinase/acetone carboxylase beta subunit